MPGIVGVIGLRGEAAAKRTVTAMISTMRHEPGYTFGFVANREQHVYSAWIAHPDSFAERISGRFGDKGSGLAFCGELFGSGLHEVSGRARLKSRVFGHGGFGCHAARQLNGHFSGFLVDVSAGTSTLFCDRFPMERIYVHEKKDVVYFASELKALLFVLPELRRFDPRGVAQFLAYGCTFGEQTLFRGVRRLPGASFWEFKSGRCISQSRYFEPKEWVDQASLSERAFEEEFVSIFRSILPLYFQTTQELGISVTGGLDTRMIMAGLPDCSFRPVCYTYAGLTGETLDVRLGREVATNCGLDHAVLRLKRDFLTDFQSYLDGTVFVTDGSAGALGAHELYYSELARQQAIVRLTGNFGSEVLRSMSTLKPASHPSGFLSVTGNELIDAAQVSVPRAENAIQSAFRDIPWHLFGTLAACRSKQVFRTPYMDNDVVRLAARAPESARTSANSALRFIEARDPRLSRIPTDRALRYGDGRMLGGMKRLAAELSFKLDYLDKEGLPGKLRWVDPGLKAASRAGLLGQHKFLSYRRWFRHELRPVVVAALQRARGAELPWINSDGLSAIDAEHATGRANRLFGIHAVLTLEAVNRLLVRGEGFGTMGILEYRD